MLTPQENINLSRYSTMRLGGPARYLLEIHESSEIAPAISWAEAKKLPVMMIGVGSNIIWQDKGFPGLILVNNIMGFDLQKQDYSAFLTVGAGEQWDSVVERVVNEDLSGIEHLSLIPGKTGATPVQNVGAYGREIADTLVCVQAYDKKEKKMIVIPKVECGFSYRASRFNGPDKNRFFITSITLALSHDPPMPPFYFALQHYIKEHDITNYTPQNIRDAVIAIRSSKLPDPAEIANCGSFFKNPIIGYDLLMKLIEKYPGIKYWEISSDQYKISAAWLLEHLGLKGYHEPNTGMAIWDKQALVFVNEKAPNTASLIAFRDAIITKVKDMFDIDLVQEPELI